MLRQASLSSLPQRGLALNNRHLQLLQLPAKAAKSRAQPLQASHIPIELSTTVLCSDEKALDQAIEAVREAGSCVLDCEGHELGDAQGHLTIIQIIPMFQDKHSITSYILDVQTMVQRQVSLLPLKQLLSQPSITKVLYDCRNDAAALWHEHQCKLEGVLDLQLLDLLVWESSATEQQRLQRLKGYMKSNPERAPYHYRGVYQISGLRGALIANKVALPSEVQAHLSVKKNLQPGWSVAWLQRPLDSRLLEYAVYDVLSILALYRHFDAGGWVDRFNKDVRSGSKVYANIYTDVPYERSNPYQNHPLLPFHVLTRLPPGGKGKASEQRECSGCRRELNESCFSKRKKFCYVCGCINDRIRRGLK